MAWAVIAVAFLLFPPYLQRVQAHGKTQGSENEKFDGKWWLKSSSEERVGFLYALDDCLTSDVKPALRFDSTWVDYEQKISAYYQSSPLNLASSVQDIFRRLGTTAVKTAPLSDRYGEEFWRAHSEPARSGFIEGYLSCRSQYKGTSAWSAPVSFYVNKLNDMYNVDDRKGENTPEYRSSIASALEKLKDPE